MASDVALLKKQEKEQRQALVKQKKFLIDSLARNREAFAALNKLRKRIQELTNESKA